MRLLHSVAFLFLIILGSKTALAQRYFITNQYSYDLYFMNPAAAALKVDCHSFSAYVQKQWFGTDLSPSTQILSYQQAFMSNVGIGSYIYNDQNGNHHEFGANQTFAYKVKLLKQKRRASSLHFGMSMMANYRYLDVSGFGEAGQLDPIISGAKNSGFGLNANAGVILSYNKWHFGFSATNLVPFNNTMYSINEEPPPHLDLNFHITTYYHILDPDLYIEPTIFYRRNNYIDKKTDINLRVTMPTIDPYLTWWGLISYKRTMDEAWGENLGFSTTLGLYYKNYMIGMEYLLSMTDTRKYFGSSYQIILGYKFCRDRKREAIYCTEEAIKKRSKH